MKHPKNLLYLLLILPVFFAGCSKDDKGTNIPVDPIVEAQVLAEFLEANGNYVYDMPSFVIGAADVRQNMLTDPARQYIIDIRAAQDFAAGHIEGAVNIAFKDVITHIQGLTHANYDKIVIACYSGQSSAYSVSLVRAKLGLSKVVSLKWGMSAWNEDFAQNYWLSKMLNEGAADFQKGESPAKNAKGDVPKLQTGKTSGSEILDARLTDALNNGYSPTATVAYGIVKQNPGNYYIVNYWPPNLYKDVVGHIPGAIHYDPAAKPFQLAADLKTLPTNKTIVLYCFTGQTSSYFGAYLRLLGYDVKSLLYGANSMVYDIMKSNNVPNTFIPETEIKNYPYVTTP